MYEIIYKRSDKLNDDEKQQYCQLFFDVFNKKKSIDFFDRQFLNNYKDRGYHSFYLCDGKIVGAYSVIPVEYSSNDSPLSVGLVIDTMIHEDYRKDPFMVKKMSKILYPEMTNDGIQFLLGFPNENIFKYRLRILKWTAISDLSFYLLPVNTGAFIPYISILNPFLRFGSRMITSILKLSASKKINEPAIAKIINDRFLQFRYDENYITINCNDECEAVYIIYKEDNKTIAYLIDFHPVSAKNFYSAMSKVAAEAGKAVDAVIYVGHLPFSSILKIPSFKQPKQVHMAGFVLDDNLNKDFMFNINNWQVNLSDFDVR